MDCELDNLPTQLDDRQVTDFLELLTNTSDSAAFDPEHMNIYPG
jgi:hypothetical protein